MIFKDNFMLGATLNCQPMLKSFSKECHGSLVNQLVIYGMGSYSWALQILHGRIRVYLLPSSMFMANKFMWWLQSNVSFFWSSSPHYLWNSKEFSCLFLQNLVHRFPWFPNGLKAPSLLKCFFIRNVDFGDFGFQRKVLKLHFLGMPLNLSKIYNHIFSGNCSLLMGCWLCYWLACNWCIWFMAN